VRVAANAVIGTLMVIKKHGNGYKIIKIGRQLMSTVGTMINFTISSKCMMVASVSIMFFLQVIGILLNLVVLMIFLIFIIFIIFLVFVIVCATIIVPHNCFKFFLKVTFDTNSSN